MTGPAGDADLPFPLSGSTLVTGPSNVGKTRLTAAALDAWVDARGASGVVVLDFAPELRRDGRLLGGRLDRFATIPADVWYGVLDAHAPRAEGGDGTKAMALARDNAERSTHLLDVAPRADSSGGGRARSAIEPTAVFVNDATIPFQSGRDSAPLEAYCDRAEVAVLNAFAGDGLGTDDPVSTHERAALDRLAEWADGRVRLPESDADCSEGDPD